MRANTQKCTARGAGDKKGGREFIAIVIFNGNTAKVIK